MIRIPDRRDRHIGPVLERIPAFYHKLAGLWNTQRHMHISMQQIAILIFFFWQRSHLTAEAGVASLSALCSLFLISFFLVALPHHPICTIIVGCTFIIHGTIKEKNSSNCNCKVSLMIMVYLDSRNDKIKNVCLRTKVIQYAQLCR